MRAAPMSSSTRRIPELLAPAGQWESLRAAVANGADAVYFGLEDFNARRRAANFHADELPDLFEYLRRHNVRGYVTLNTLLFPPELPAAARLLAALAQAGADAVIVQDLGLLRLARRLAPTLPVHASTQMTQTTAEGIALLAALGVQRVIVARELSVPELGRLVAAAPLPIEIFIHGALCISFSGQCLASAAFWDRSANRGTCAQACRLPYELIVDGQPVARHGRRYPLSAQDLCAPQFIPRLAEIGVAALKIEGRLKSPAYVAAATRFYRAALDACATGAPFDPTPQQQAELAQAFSRGSGPGFLGGVDHQALVPGRFPKHRGVRIGRATRRTARGIVVQLAPGAAIRPGDGLVFDAGRPDRDEQGGRAFTVTPQGADQVEVTFGSTDVVLAAVPLPSLVWRTDDPALRRALDASYRRDVVIHRSALHVELSARPDQPLQVILRDDAGHTVTVHSATPLAAAVKHPLTVDLARAQFGRLGDTPFTLDQVTLTGPDGPASALPVLAPKSVLNDLRRAGVARLLEIRSAHARHAIAAGDVVETERTACRAILGAPAAPQSVATAELHVLARTAEQAHALLDLSGAAAFTWGLLYCELAATDDFRCVIAHARAAGRRIGAVTPRVLLAGDESRLGRLAALPIDAFLVRNLSALRRLGELAPALPRIGDTTLNAANALAVASLVAAGCTRVTACNDLHVQHLAALLAEVPGTRLEVVVHQRIALFHTRHCLYAAALSSGPCCGACQWPCRGHALRLRNRSGEQHPVLPDEAGCNTIYHARPQSAAACAGALYAAGARHFRIELLDETAQQAVDLVHCYTGILQPGAPAALGAELARLGPSAAGTLPPHTTPAADPA